MNALYTTTLQVYDLSEFQTKHSGGATVLQSQAGKDVTAIFRNQCHPEHALECLEQYRKGDIDSSEKVD